LNFLSGFGACRAPRKTGRFGNKSKLTSFIYFPVERQDVEATVDLKFELRQKGWQLELVDALSAVIALRYDLILLTKDRDFLAVPGLVQESWL
jgi:predicted nucleic acid-binding protein